MDTEDPPLLRPVPRRPFDSTAHSSSTASTHGPAPNRTLDFASQLEAKLDQSRNGSLDAGQRAEYADGSTTPARNKSILNLTASTLFGIYSPTERYGFADGSRGDYSEPQTPWGTGAETPSLREAFEFGSSPRGRPIGRLPTPVKQQFAKASVLPKALRILALFVFGVSYGVIIEHLHDQRHLAPVKLELEGLDRNSWWYLSFWGVAGVIWGLLLPWVDLIWEEKTPPTTKKNGGKAEQAERVREGVEFLQMVRIIGGFIGIAFAARKLAWRSTLQASIALSLVNPALWYLFDRTRSGFTLSLVIGLTGTLILLFVNPDMVPSPSAVPQNGTYFNRSTDSELFAGVVSYESVGVATWIASVLFCSCICFGNIGRRLSGWGKEGS